MQIVESACVHKSSTSLMLDIYSWNSNAVKTLHIYTLLTELYLENCISGSLINKIFYKKPFKFCLRNLSILVDNKIQLLLHFFCTITWSQVFKNKTMDHYLFSFKGNPSKNLPSGTDFVSCSIVEI